jgi:hypothetical protein
MSPKLSLGDIINVPQTKNRKHPIRHLALEPLVWKCEWLQLSKYSLERITMLKNQQDWATKTKVVEMKYCVYRRFGWLVGLMVFKATFNNISAICRKSLTNFIT